MQLNMGFFSLFQLYRRKIIKFSTNLQQMAQFSSLGTNQMAIRITIRVATLDFYNREIRDPVETPNRKYGPVSLLLWIVL